MSKKPPQPLIAVPPALPKPPQGITDPRVLDYLNQLVRSIEGYIRLQTGTPLLRGSGLFLPGLPTSDSTLADDMVFNSNGYLALVRPDRAAVGGVSTTMSLGRVTTSP